MKSGTEVAGVKTFPVLAEIVTERSPVLKMGDDDKHTLQKIGAWLSGGKTLYIHGIEDATFNGQPCKAAKIKVPNPNKPGDWQEFHLIIDDVGLKEPKSSTH